MSWSVSPVDSLWSSCFSALPWPFVRLAKGPDAADRIVALDLISILIVAFLAAYSIYARETSFLDVAIAFALIAFLGTVALARFLMRSAKTGHKQETEQRNEDNE